MLRARNKECCAPQVPPAPRVPRRSVSECSCGLLFQEQALTLGAVKGRGRQLLYAESLKSHGRRNSMSWRSLDDDIRQDVDYALASPR